MGPARGRNRRQQRGNMRRADLTARLSAWRGALYGTMQRLTSRVMWLGLGVIIVVFIGLFIWQAFRIRDMRVEYDQTVVRIDALKARNDKLQNQLDYLKGPGFDVYAERVAREALGLAKPGETVILPLDPTPQTINAPAPTPVAVAAASNSSATLTPPQIVTPQPKNEAVWQHWVDLVFGS